MQQSSDQGPAHMIGRFLFVIVQDRYRILDQQVERPRDIERAQIARESRLERRHRQHCEYDYGKEAFSIRRKNFWPLTQVRKLLDTFIPGLSHESDGLIFQVSSTLQIIIKQISKCLI